MKPSRITKRNPSTDSDLKDSDSDSVPGTHCLEGSSAMSTDPPIIGPLPVKDCPLELNLSIAMPPQSLDSQATPTASQVTPTTSAQATPNIPLATPINITSFSSTTTNSFCSLLNRHVAADMYPSLPALKRQLYSLPSMVQRLALERRLQEHEGCVNCINFSWAGNLLASGSDDLQVVLWDWAKGKPVSKFASGHVANVFQVSPKVTDHTWMVTSFHFGNIDPSHSGDSVITPPTVGTVLLPLPQWGQCYDPSPPPPG